MSKPSTALIEHIYRMAGGFRDDSSSDATLLSRYAEMHDEKAFSALMVRHGVMVWSICRRILGNTQDTEEAYQTTFLALASKANTIRLNEPLVGWLHQVAYRTAISARRKVRGQLKLQEGLKALAPVEAAAGIAENEIYEELHSEIAKLPEKLRVALVLHYLEGKAQTEVAGILGITKSAVRARLNRGEASLEKRLRQRGLVMGVAALKSLMAEAASDSAMPPGLVSRTVRAATAFRDGDLCGGLAKLTREVLKSTPSTTPWWKSAWMITILCIGGIGAGAGGVAWRAGFFGTKADDPIFGPKKQGPQQAEKEKPSRNDLYGDPLPSGALVRLGTTRFRGFIPAGLVRDQAPLFTRDGKGLVICALGGPARLCDATTGKVLREFGNDVRGAALSADGLVLAGRSPDEQGGLCIWEVNTGKLLRQMDLGELDLDSHLVFSPDGKIVASTAYGSRICAVETATGDALWNLRLSHQINSIRYSSDGAKLLVFDGRKLHFLDARSASKLGSLGSEEDQRVRVAYACSADARLAVFASTVEVKIPGQKAGEQQFETKIRIWNVATQKELSQSEVWKAKLGFDTRLALSPDGKILAMVDRNEGLIRLCNVATSKELRRCQKSQTSINGLAFSPNGKVIAAICCDQTNSSSLHLWDAESGREITPNYVGHAGVVTSIVFTPDGKEIVSGGDDNAFHTWDAATGVERLCWGRLGDPSRVMKGAVAPDGRTAAVYINREGKIRPAIKVIRRNGRDSEEVYQLPLPTRANYFLCFSPDSRTLACANPTDSELVLLWDLTTGRELPTITGALTAFAPDGKTMASGRDTAAIAASMLEVRTGKELCIIPRGERDAQGRPIGDGIGGRGWAFSPDGRILAGVGMDDKIRLWNVLTAYGSVKSVVRNCRAIENASTKFGSSSFHVPLVFSPDGSMFAASDKDNCVRVWETTTGQERLRFKGHENQIYSIAFAPDGRRLASSAMDTSILIWDLTGGRLDSKGNMVASRLSGPEMEALWRDLIGWDARRAARAIWALASAGEPAVFFLEKRLKPAPPHAAPPPKIVAQLISDLDASAFKVRKQAFDALAKFGAEFGEACEPALQQALTKKPSIEVQRQLKSLLSALSTVEERRGEAVSSEEVVAFRAIEILGHIAAPSVKKVLENLAAGSPVAPQTQAAKFALKRMTRR